jgi:hypothetical protein
MSVFKNIYQKNYEKMDDFAKLDDFQNFFSMRQIFENALINSFVWKNLPEHIYFTRPEQHLYYRGVMAMFKDDEGILQIYPAFPSGALRGDGFWTEYTMYDFAGKIWRRKFEDIEICENIPNQLPTLPFVNYYCDRMKKVLNVIDVQLIKSQGGDIFEVEDEQQAKQVAEIWDNMLKNRPLNTIINDTFSKRQINKISLYDSRESQILDMWEIYDKYKHEFMTYMGLNNVETEKKERLLTNEVDGNNDIIKHGFYETQYLCRLDFCRRCKEHFDIDIMVFKNRNEETVDEQQDFIDEFVSGDNEELVELNDEINETPEEVTETDVIEDKKEEDETYETNE